MPSRVDRTQPGSKNDWRITYDTGSQKWTDDRPGDGIGESSGDLLKQTLEEPAVQRGLTAIQSVIEGGGDLKPAVDGLIRDTGTEKGKTVLNAVYRASKGQKNEDGWNKARKMVAFEGIVAAVMDRVDPEKLPTLWYENEAGDKFIPDMSGNTEPETPPEGFDYQHSQFSDLRHSVLEIVQQEDVDACDHPESHRKKDLGMDPAYGEGEECRKCGGYREKLTGQNWGPWRAVGSREIIVMNSGWPEDLALAIANSGVRLSKAIQISANACERCMNALAYEFGLDWGYPEMSEEWKRCGTECDFCRGLGYNREPVGDRAVRVADAPAFNLKSYYNKFNQKYFDGELPSIPVKWSKTRRAAGRAHCIINRRTGEITPKKIDISTFMKMTEERLTKTLLHEMVHIWQFVHNIWERQDAGHGRTFRQKAREVGNKAGVVIAVTEDISGLEIAEDTKATSYVVVFWGKNYGHMSLFYRGSFDSNRMSIERYFEREAKIYDAPAKFYSTQERDLMRYTAMRKIGRSIRYYPVGRLDLSMLNRIKSEGKLIGEIKPKPKDPALDKMRGMFSGIAKFMVGYLETRFEPSKWVSTVAIDGDRVVAQIIPKSGNARGLIQISGMPPDDIGLFLMRDQHIAFKVEGLNKYPTVKTLAKLIDDVEAKEGSDTLSKAWGVPLKKVASVVSRIREAFYRSATFFDIAPLGMQGAEKMNEKAAKELIAAIRDLLAAEELRPVTADEMEHYCPDCARQIRAGEMEMTHGELRQLLADFEAHGSMIGRVAAKWESLPRGWTDASRQKYWDTLTGDVKHKVTKCIKEMEGKIGDPGAFCASLADRVDPGWRSR